MRDRTDNREWGLGGLESVCRVNDLLQCSCCAAELKLWYAVACVCVCVCMCVCVCVCVCVFSSLCAELLHLLIYSLGRMVDRCHSL